MDSASTSSAQSTPANTRQSRSRSRTDSRRSRSVSRGGRDVRVDSGADRDSPLKLYRSSSLTRTLSSESLFQFKQPTRYASTAKAISDEPKLLAQQQKQKDKVDQKKSDNPCKFQANAYSFLWKKVDTDYDKTFAGIQERLEKQSPGVDFREDKFPGSGETHVCLACTELKDIKEKNIDQKQKKITKLINMITAMTSLGANARSPDARGRHPLYILMMSDYFQRGSQDITDLIQKLIEASGANDGDTRDEEAELTVIMQFIHDNDHERLRFLLEHGASPDKPGRSGNTPLLLAINENRVECLKILLESGADTEKAGGDGNTPLLYTITKNKHQCACILLEQEADPDQAGEDGITPLLHAINKNRKKFVSTLLKFNADPNRSHQTDVTQSPLLVTAWGNKIEILNILFKESQAPVNVNIAEPNEKSTALMAASHLGHHSVVERLLTHGATIDQLSNHRETALFMALRSARGQKIATIMTLLEAGANTNTTSDDGSTPLSLTLAIDDSTERNTILDQLLKNSANTNKTDQEGNHALLILCMNTKKESGVNVTVTKLIMHGATIHHLNNNNETALFHAVRNRNLGAVQAILMTNNPSRSALWNDYNRTNHDGVSIRQMITEQNYRQEEPEIYQLLCSFLQGPAHESHHYQIEEERKQLQESLKTKEHELARAKSDYEESSQGMLKEISTLERQLDEPQIKVQDMQETLTSKEEGVPEKSTTTEQALHEDQERLKSQILAVEILRGLERKALLDAAKEQRQSTTTEMAKLKVEVALKSLQLTQMEQELVKLQAQVEATSPHLSTADKSPEASCLPVSEEAEISLSAEQVWASVHSPTQMPDSESTRSATAPVEKSQVEIIQKPLLPITKLSRIPAADSGDIAAEDDDDIKQLTQKRDQLLKLKKQQESEMQTLIAQQKLSEEDSQRLLALTNKNYDTREELDKTCKKLDILQQEKAIEPATQSPVLTAEGATEAQIQTKEAAVQGEIPRDYSHLKSLLTQSFIVDSETEEEVEADKRLKEAETKMHAELSAIVETLKEYGTEIEETVSSRQGMPTSHTETQEDVVALPQDLPSKIKEKSKYEIPSHLSHSGSFDSLMRKRPESSEVLSRKTATASSEEMLTTIQKIEASTFRANTSSTESELPDSVLGLPLSGDYRFRRGSGTSSVSSSPAPRNVDPAVTGSIFSESGTTTTTEQIAAQLSAVSPGVSISDAPIIEHEEPAELELSGLLTEGAAFPDSLFRPIKQPATPEGMSPSFSDFPEDWDSSSGSEQSLTELGLVSDIEYQRFIQTLAAHRQTDTSDKNTLDVVEEKSEDDSDQ